MKQLLKQYSSLLLLNNYSNIKKCCYNNVVKGGDVRPLPLSKVLATGEQTSAYDHGAPMIGGTMRSRIRAGLVDKQLVAQFESFFVALCRLACRSFVGQLVVSSSK